MAKITIEELSGSLKEYLNGLGLTEAQVQELIDKFEDEKIGDISQLSTEEKGSLVGAINELFQSANNGKELIANAIGEPLSSEDTFSAMSNDINSLLSQFKTNMMNSGVMVESGDKFKSLIDKINGLTEGEGNKSLKFANGNMYYDDYHFEITNLSFKPSIIIIINDDYYSWYDATVDDENYSVYTNGEVITYGINDSTFDTYISDTGFSMHVPLGNDYSYWYAIGVGEEDTALRDSLAGILEDEGVSVTEEDDMASLITKVDEEFDKQVVPAGDAVASDVLSGKTFINSTGQLVTGTGNLTRMLTTGSQTITVSTDSPPEQSFKKTVNHSFGAVPSNIIIITSNVVLETDSTTRFTAYNIVLKNGTTAIPYKTVYSSATDRYGGISITNITETTFDISVKASYWATSSNATCTIKVANIIYY